MSITRKLSKEETIISEKGDYFIDEFFTAIERWFSTSIACCDSCIDDFLEYWPLADSLNDFEFQKSCIDLACLYSGSPILFKAFTKEEFDILVKIVPCPRCDSPLRGNIWTYELPFASEIYISDFESNIKAIAELSARTPFLLLTNNFALEIYELIHDHFKNVKSVLPQSSFYRARLTTEVMTLDYKEFTVAPKSVIGEGRYNHSGDQVFYLSSDIDTCFNELGGKLCYIAEINLTKEIKILDLTEPEEKSSTLNALVASALLNSPISATGYDKPAYVFSRFVADCAKSAGFDAIKYPSTKLNGYNYNLAIIKQEVFKDFVNFNGLYFSDGKNHYNLSK